MNINTKFYASIIAFLMITSTILESNGSTQGSVLSAYMAPGQGTKTETSWGTPNYNNPQSNPYESPESNNDQNPNNPQPNLFESSENNNDQDSNTSQPNYSYSPNSNNNPFNKSLVIDDDFGPFDLNFGPLDLNKDGSKNILDVLLLISFVFGDEFAIQAEQEATNDPIYIYYYGYEYASQYSYFDYNKDGSVDIIDVVHMMEVILEGP